MRVSNIPKQPEKTVPFIDAMSRADQWEKVSTDNGWLYQATQFQFMPLRSTLLGNYTLSDISAVDTRLVPVIDAATRGQPYNRATLPTLYNYWNTPACDLPPESQVAQKELTTARVAQFRGLTRYAEDTAVAVHALVYHLDDCSPPWPSRLVDQVLVLKTAWLDQRFPGWRNREKTAFGLGLSDDAAATYILPISPDQDVQHHSGDALDLPDLQDTCE